MYPLFELFGAIYGAWHPRIEWLQYGVTIQMTLSVNKNLAPEEKEVETNSRLGKVIIINNT